MTCLERFEESWLVFEEGDEETIVDRAWDWVLMQADGNPLVQEALPGLRAAARDQVEWGWERDHVRSVSQRPRASRCVG